MRVAWSRSARQAPLALSPARIETLPDGVFAIAMTLLVLDLAVPEVAPYILSGSSIDPSFVVSPDL